MSVADFFDLRVSLKNMINDELGTIRQQIDAINMLINNLDMRVNIANENISILNSTVNALQTQVNNVNTRVTNLENSVNTRFDQMGLRINDVEQNILYLQQNIQGQINLINQELARTVKKATPMPGYNPYNVGGGISAQVWLYDITTIDDSNIRFYYVQFNNISGNPAHHTDWVPLPRTFGNFIYSYHPEYFPLPPGPDQPFAVSGRGGTSYTLEMSTGEAHFRLWYNAGPTDLVGDYIGFILVGNASSPGPTEEDIEKMSVEELRKLTKELHFKAKQIEDKKNTQDKAKLRQEMIEQMKRMKDYDFVPVQPKMTQSTTKK
jgi:signal recognition particle subunit SEC65